MEWNKREVGNLNNTKTGDIAKHSFTGFESVIFIRRQEVLFIDRKVP